MPDAKAESIGNAFLRGWVQRFGIPRRILTDNAQTFVGDLWRNLQQQLGVEVSFSPPFHQATNGAVERAHQTIKNSLKASLLEMGDTYQSRWMERLPFTLLGKRISYQPDLDTSSAELVLGTTVTVPGALVGDPGPPLNKSEIHKLLNVLHQKAARPSKPMSRHMKPEEIYMPEDIQKATHVYILLDKTNPLSKKYFGPCPIVSRPSKTTVTIKKGTYVSGLPVLTTVHWSLCKVANKRPEALEGQCPTRGRPRKLTPADTLNASSWKTPTLNRAEEFHAQNKQDGTDNTLLVTQPNTTNVADSASELDFDPHRDDIQLTTGAGGGEYVSSTPPGQWQLPQPSPALAGSPAPFSGYHTPDRTANNAESSDEDEPFHGFQTQDTPQSENNTNNRGRPKRKTKPPDRYQDFVTYATRTLF